MRADKMIGSPFGSIIKDLPDNYNVKLGTENGSGFFWAGTTGELKHDFSKINAIARTYWERTVDKARKKLHRIDEPTFVDFVREEVSRYYLDKHYKPDFNEEDFQKYLKNWREKFIKTAEAAVYEIGRFHEFLPLNKRTVKDVTPSIAEDDTIIIIVTGSEYGKAWTVEEYYEQTGKKKETS